ncbi:MAG: hypothetical protein QOJ56_2840 [Mycobacterium sp.]|nr:hypothetical protein [Mycobacterium sp.]
MKIVPTRIEQQINRVDRTRSLMIGISCGLLALWSITGCSGRFTSQ